MSNPLTILHNFDQPVYSPDFNTIVSALDYKQTAYSANKAKLQSLYDQLDALKVKKGIDQEYIEGRLQQVKELTNQYNHIDLSNSSFADAMYNNVSQAVDEKVENAVYSTRLWEAEDKKWADFREKKGDKYWEGNEAYSKYMSDRNRYLNSTEAGDKYNGGADILEFQDIDKKALDQLQNIIKNATHKYIQETPGAGQFTSLSTMEVISRPEVEAQLRASMNEKEWDQFKINAWNKYGGADDNYLKARKEQIDANTLSEIDDSLDALRKARGSVAEDQEKILEDRITYLEQRKQDITNTSYEDVIKNQGKDGFYTKIYEDEFFGEYLKGFSYEPREIKREVDQTRKAAIEFNEKVREFNAEMGWKRYEFDNLSAKEKEDIRLAEAKLQLEYGNALNPSGMPTPKSNSEALIGLEEGKEIDKSGLYLNKKAEAKAANDAAKLLGKTKLSSKDFAELNMALSDKNLEKARENGEIVVGGKTIDLNVKNLAVLLNLKNKVLSDSPSEKKATQGAYNAITSAARNIAVLSGDSDFNINDLPDYGVKLVANEEGGFKVVTAEKGYFQRLARNYENLSKAEKATLQYYSAVNMIADPKSNLSLYEKGSLAKAVRTEILKGTKTSEMSKLPVTVEDIQEAHSVLTKQGKGSSVTLISDISKLNGKMLRANSIAEKQEFYRQIQEKQNKLTRINTLVRTTGTVKNAPLISTTYDEREGNYNNKNFISNISTYDAEYWLNGTEKSARAGKDIYGDVKTSLKIVDEDLKNQFNIASTKGFSYSPGTKGYEDLKRVALADGVITDPKYKGPLEVVPTVGTEEGVITEVKVTRPYESDIKGVKSISNVSKKMSLQDLQSRAPSLNFEMAQRSMFDATYKDNAAKASLGKGIPLSEATNADPFWTQAADFQRYAIQIGKFEEIDGVIKGYNKGDYTFKLEPVNKQKGSESYGVKIYKQGKPVYGFDLGLPRMTEEDAAAYILETYKTVVPNAMSSYVGSILR